MPRSSYDLNHHVILAFQELQEPRAEVVGQSQCYDSSRQDVELFGRMAVPNNRHSHHDRQRAPK